MRKTLLVGMLGLAISLLASVNVAASSSKRLYTSAGGIFGYQSGFENNSLGVDARYGVKLTHWACLEGNYIYLNSSNKRKGHTVTYSSQGKAYEAFEDSSLRTTANTFLGALRFSYPTKNAWLELLPYVVGGVGVMTVNTRSTDAYFPDQNYSRTESDLSLKGGVGIYTDPSQTFSAQLEGSYLTGPIHYRLLSFSLMARF